MLYIDNNEVLRITDDEAFQFAPAVSNNIIVFHENDDAKESDISYGHLVVYDLENKVRRKVESIAGIVSTLHMNGSKIIYTPDIYSSVGRIYLVDLEKLGIVKDGHVVPE